jgi:hypothetical protein
VETAERDAFVQNYGKLVVRTWTDPDYLQSLESDPNTAVQEEGLPLTDGATVRVWVIEPTGKGSVDDQVEAWDRGVATGKYDLFVAKKPADFGGEGLKSQGGGTYCCCPCCCCT